MRRKAASAAIDFCQFSPAPIQPLPVSILVGAEVRGRRAGSLGRHRRAGAQCLGRHWVAPEITVSVCSFWLYCLPAFDMGGVVTASRYKVWAWGGPVGLGVTGSVYVSMSAVAKKATPVEPYIVGNELVCNMVARALLLPCPPG